MNKDKRFKKLLLINFLSKNPNLDQSNTYVLPVRNEDLTDLDNIYTTYYVSYTDKWIIKEE
tara:strand:+ start:190 stop:372 length:183 start_codon:yes stop_codon:yes gene_type:complete